MIKERIHPNGEAARDVVAALMSEGPVRFATRQVAVKSD